MGIDVTPNPQSRESPVGRGSLTPQKKNHAKQTLQESLELVDASKSYPLKSAVEVLAKSQRPSSTKRWNWRFAWE